MNFFQALQVVTAAAFLSGAATGFGDVLKMLPPISDEAPIPEGTSSREGSFDSTYGYSAENPIKLGDRDPTRARGVVAEYLNSLRDRDGKPISWKPLSSVNCTDAQSAPLSYEVKLEDGTVVKLWLSPQFPHKLPDHQPAPAGFRKALVKGELSNRPRWGVLGEDTNLDMTIAEADHVVVLRINRFRLENVKPPFAVLVHSAIVSEVLKGPLSPGDEIEVDFPTDMVPADEAARKQWMEKIEGDTFRIAFLRGKKDGRFETEWLYLPTHSDEMHFYLSQELRPPK